MLALIAAPPSAITTATRFFSVPANLLSFALFALLTTPLMLSVRWAIDIQIELASQPLWSWRRLRGPLAALLLLGAGMSVLTLYSEDVRQAMIQMHGLIQEGLTTSSKNDLPPALNTDDVHDFLVHAKSNYTLEQSYDDQYQRDFAATLSSDGPIILARFQNGWLLACRFSLQFKTLHCKSYELPTERQE